MRKIMKKSLFVFVATTMIMALCATFATASKVSRDIELTTRSALLVDRSGSIEDQKEVEDFLSRIKIGEYDFVGYFDDQQVSVDPSYIGGGNSAIVETIDQMAVRGFTHIAVITDGEQWPADYSALSAYTDLDLTFYLVGDKVEAAQELVDNLAERIYNSNLKVVRPDGSEEVILEDYIPPRYLIQFDIPENDYHCEHNCLWWVALLGALLGAAIFDTIHELITRRRVKEDGKEKEKEGNQDNPVVPTPTSTPIVPIPTQAIAGIARGSHVLADFSGSMAAQQRATAEACKGCGASSILCFGDKVEEVKPDEINFILAGGQTPGWEALEDASAKGWNDVTIVSDLGFNGKPFNEKNFRRFKRIAVVVPSRYNSAVLENLRLIADEVEVIPLQ